MSCVGYFTYNEQTRVILYPNYEYSYYVRNSNAR